MTNEKVLQAEQVERFSPIRRLEHSLVILWFTLLALSGLAQKFYEAPWARSFLDSLGGVDGTRSLHHAVGIVAVLHLLGHAAAILWGLVTKKLRLSLLPVPQDLRDFIATWRYRFGLSQEPPKYSVFDYHQKFQYLGILLSGSVVILSGLILLFPQTAILIIPGHVIPAARECHFNDGLVAFSLLVVWHFYATFLSPESRPTNTSIFTGYMTRKELKRRHARYYERLFGKD